MEYAEFRAMNSAILLAADGAADAVARGFVQARAFVEASEARLTRFSETSELAQLNRSGGTWFLHLNADGDTIRTFKRHCAVGYIEQQVDGKLIVAGGTGTGLYIREIDTLCEVGYG